jgi:predicted aspartyl protease
MPRIQDAIGFDGAIIVVQIELSEPEEGFLRSTGQPVPRPFVTTALIDTGASHTSVHPMILEHLGAVQWGEAWSSVPGVDRSTRGIYDVRLSVGSVRPGFEVQVVNVEPATHTVAVLIGRDILKKGTLLFDGENETFSFWF